MKIFFLNLIIILGFGLQTSFAQLDSSSCISLDSVKSLYNRKTIYFGSGNYFYLDGKKQKVGAFGKNFINDLKKYPEAYDLFNEGMKIQTAGTILYISAIGGLISTIFFPPSILVFASTLGTSLPILFISFKLMAKGGDKMSESIWIRNREALVQ